MTTSIPPTWTTGKPPNRFAALPSGRIGSLGGRMMKLLNGPQQREILAVIGGPAGDVVEIGHGPGTLLGPLAAGASHVVGIDPSPEMRLLAIRANAERIAGGQLAIRAGDAAATGLADRSADLVVSVNIVAIWPDLDAAVAELRRVLRPSGRLVLSWHGGRQPSRAASRMLLSDDRLARIEDELRRHFADVRRARTRRCEVFDAHV